MIGWLTGARPPVSPCAVALLLAALVSAAPAPASAQTAAKIPGTSCTAFPADSWWNADVSGLKVHPKSAAWMANMQPTRNLHPDFGPSYGAIPGPYGIPITIVDGSHPKVKVRFDYADESDRVRYPLGPKTKVEGWSYTAGGDQHTITVDKSTCRLYETFYTRRDGAKWIAGSGAVWDLGSNRLRRKNWTSADAAGLPILPGLLRYDEVKRGKVDHAIRFTTNVTDKRFLWPARHQAGSVRDPNYPPMGARFRLKASYRIKPGLRSDTKTVLKAMKRYGLVLADNGTPWFFQGAADRRWPEALIVELKQIPASAFEAVDTLPLRVSRNSMKVKPAP
ncbi:MAG TPA: hypothetical protein VMP03_06370 [Methylomirabilota bacterium]|nr:hypothetical protein [Methylomirabilota bacterium]